MKEVKLNKKSGLEVFKAVNNKGVNIPFVDSSVSAGCFSPTLDYFEKAIDIADILIKNPDATFYIRVNGESMIDANLHDNDVLVVDKSLKAKNGDIIVAILDRDYTVKTFRPKNEEIYLEPANKNYQTIKITGLMDFEVWGVVTFSIHKH